MKLLWVAAAMQAIGTVLASVYAGSDANTEALLSQMSQQTNFDGSLGSMQTAAVVVAIVAGTAALVLYVMVAHYVGQGRIWARTLGTAVALLTVLQLIAVEFPAGIVTAVQAILVVLGILLCYLPIPRLYFESVRIYRINQRPGT